MDNNKPRTGQLMFQILSVLSRHSPFIFFLSLTLSLAHKTTTAIDAKLDISMDTCCWLSFALWSAESHCNRYSFNCLSWDKATTVTNITVKTILKIRRPEHNKWNF